MEHRALNVVSSKNLVAQANALIRARYKTTRNEELLLKAMMSLIEPSDKEFMVLTASVSQLSEILGMDKDSALREFDKITTRLMSKVIKIETEEGWNKFQWVSRSSLKNGLVSIQFHDDLKPYLLALRETGYFTQYRLEDVVWFKSAYTSRMYELLIEANNKKQRVIYYKVDDFRERMLGERSKSYPLFKDFRKWVINVAQKELAQKNEYGVFRSKLNFEVSTQRTGRKITDLEFRVIKQNTATKNLQESSKNQNTQNEKPQSGNATITLLVKFGVAQKKAEELVTAYSPEYIQEKINLYGLTAEYKEIKNPSGWLVKAIEGDYKNPEEVKKEDESKKQAEIRKKLIEEQKKRLAEEAKAKAERAIKESFLDALSDDQKTDLISTMKQEHPDSAELLKDVTKGMGRAFLSFYIPDYQTKVEEEFLMQKKRG